MKKIILTLSLLVIAIQAVVAEQAATQQTTAVNPNQEGVYTRPAFETRETNYSKNSSVYKKGSGNDYILKYNIDDLEAAPWLNGGKRKI